jgi:hypothetical protein
MDNQVWNILEWSVSHKNFNHILNFNVVTEKTNLVTYILYGAIGRLIKVTILTQCTV